MAKRKNSGSSGAGSEAVTESVQHASALERIARGISLLAIRGERQDVQTELLSSIGYTPSEIAELLSTTPATVSQTLYMNRKKRDGKKSR